MPGVNERTAHRIYNKAKYPNLYRILMAGGEPALFTYAQRVREEEMTPPARPKKFFPSEEEGVEVVEPMGAPASSSMPPASRGPSLEEALRAQRLNPEPIHIDLTPGASAAAAASPTSGMTPRTRRVFTELLPRIQESASRALKFTTDKIIPILIAHGKGAMSPARDIIKAQTAETINNLREHPEMIVGIIYAMAFSYNSSQMRYIADHADIHNSLLHEIINYVKVISTGAFGGRITRSAYNVVLSLSQYYKPYIENIYRQMGDDSAAAEQRYQMQFVQQNPFAQQNPWGDATAHLTGDPLKITQQELLERLNVQYPAGAAASSSSAAAAASGPEGEEDEDKVKTFIEIISPFMEEIQHESSNRLHSLLKPKEGQYIDYLNFDGFENLNISASARKYLHENPNTFIGILYAALFRDQMDIVDTTCREKGLKYPSIDLAQEAYFKFLKSSIQKTLKIQIMNFCLQYSEKI
jgi:hypothetical protein